MWLRVFATNDYQPEPAAILEHLQNRGLDVAGSFRGDEQGWFEAELHRHGKLHLRLGRFLAGEEGVRTQLNIWAAWLETVEENPNHVRLMEQVATARQLFTLEAEEQDDDSPVPVPPAEELCRFLALETGGVYQIDGLGFFAADGTLLVGE